MPLLLRPVAWLSTSRRAGRGVWLHCEAWLGVGCIQWWLKVRWWRSQSRSSGKLGHELCAYRIRHVISPPWRNATSRLFHEAGSGNVANADLLVGPKLWKLVPKGPASSLLGGNARRQMGCPHLSCNRLAMAVRSGGGYLHTKSTGLFADT